MAGHGGTRPGAGAPPGGISQAKRLLLQGIRRGLAIAGAVKGASGDEDERATQCVAMIASDMILAGQGRDVLAILAQAAPKSEGGDGDKSPLLDALRRLPGAAAVPQSSLTASKANANAENTDESSTPVPDPQSGTMPAADPARPFFAPQYPLLRPEHEPPARAPGAGGYPLPPGSATPPPGSTPAPKILKNSGAA